MLLENALFSVYEHFCNKLELFVWPEVYEAWL